MNSQEIHWRVRLALYPELRQGFSPLNGFLAALILVSVMLCVVGTERLVQRTLAGHSMRLKFLLVRCSCLSSS